jgi:hypothetical protein
MLWYKADDKNIRNSEHIKMVVLTAAKVPWRR